MTSDHRVAGSSPAVNQLVFDAACTFLGGLPHAEDRRSGKIKLDNQHVKLNNRALVRRRGRCYITINHGYAEVTGNMGKFWFTPVVFVMPDSGSV
jgi:hypothetical protein